MSDIPKIVLLMSGKRKCGKDFLAERLTSLFNGQSCILRISEPIKDFYATKNGLNLEELMSDGPFKEQHRLAMINWSDSIRADDPGYFCKAACDKAPLNVLYWIVSDIRRKSDIKWFLDTYGRDTIRLIRITAEESIRKARGWKFVQGVDDVVSECDLDDFQEWDLVVTNHDETMAKIALDKMRQLMETQTV